MIINNNSVEQINIALLDLEKKLSTIKDDKAAIDNLKDSINIIKASLNETKAGLTSGATYDINITGNATTATTATTAGSAVSAESAERASKDGNGNNITSTYTTKEELAYVNNELNIAKKSIVPVGVIYPFGGSNEKVPDGYLPCDGRAVSRTQYSALFNVIGTSFGNGDEINTFNVPDMRESVPVGIGTRGSGVAVHDTYTLGQFKDDQFKSHNHGAKITGGKHKHWVGARNDALLNIGGDGNCIVNQGDSHQSGNVASSLEGHTHDISIYNTGGDTTHGKQVGVNYIIKY